MQARLQQINEEWKRLEEARERRERLEQTMDAIRAKYGPGAIGMASAPRDAARERHAPPPSGAGRGED